MARLGSDTPSYCSTTTLPLFWDTAHADAQVSAGSGYGGGNAWTGASESAYLRRLGFAFVPPGQSAFAIGHKLKVQTLPAAEKILLAILALDLTIQCCLSLRTDGKLSIWKGDLAGVELDRSTAAIPNGSGTWLDCGLTGLVDGSAGDLSAYIGVTGDPTSWAAVAAASGVNTRGHASDATWRGFTLGLKASMFQSDLYWRDGRTSDGGVVGLSPGSQTGTRRPNAAGLYTAWYPNTGTLHGALDDTDHDGDTTIAQSNAVPADAAFSVGLPAVTSHARYYGISTMVLARNATAFPSLGLEPLIVTDAAGTPVKHLGPRVQMTDSAWRPAWKHDAVNPRTGVLFTKAELDALQAGAESEA